MAGKRWHMIQKSPDTITTVRLIKGWLVGNSKVRVSDADAIRFALRFTLSALATDGKAEVDATAVARMLNAADPPAEESENGNG